MSSLLVMSQTSSLPHLFPLAAISSLLEWQLHILCLPQAASFRCGTDLMLQATRFLPASSASRFPELLLSSPFPFFMCLTVCPWHSLLNISLISVRQKLPGDARCDSLVIPSYPSVVSQPPAGAAHKRCGPWYIAGLKVRTGFRHS